MTTAYFSAKQPQNQISLCFHIGDLVLELSENKAVAYCVGANGESPRNRAFFNTVGRDVWGIVGKTELMSSPRGSFSSARVPSDLKAARTCRSVIGALIKIQTTGLPRQFGTFKKGRADQGVMWVYDERKGGVTGMSSVGIRDSIERECSRFEELG